MGDSPSIERVHDDHPAVTRESLFEVAREGVYAPIVGQSLVALTSKRLLTMLSLGLLEVGEQLPSEPELSERLGVSSATLREALAVLRTVGVLETRRGRGGGSVVVGDAPQPSAQDARRQLASLTFDDLRDLGEYHVALAGRASMLAAERATSGEADLLRSLVSAMHHPSPSAPFVRLDAQFHIGLASAARSARLTAGVTAVQAELGEFARLLTSSPSRLRTANAEHERIIAAVSGRDAAAARDAAERHAEMSTSLLLDARSEVSHADSYGGDGAFVGLRPFGSELGSMPKEFSHDRLPRRPESSVDPDAASRLRSARAGLRSSPAD